MDLLCFACAHKHMKKRRLENNGSMSFERLRKMKSSMNVSVNVCQTALKICTHRKGDSALSEEGDSSQA
jgi:peroxiredoxin family protein